MEQKIRRTKKEKNKDGYARLTEKGRKRNFPSRWYICVKEKSFALYLNSSREISFFFIIDKTKLIRIVQQIESISFFLGHHLVLIIWNDRWSLSSITNKFSQYKKSMNVNKSSSLRLNTEIRYTSEFIEV